MSTAASESASANPRRGSRIARVARSFVARGPLWQRLVRVAISLGVVVISMVPIARFIGVALQRLNYPFELEWIEGGSVGHIQVAMSGHQIYGEPSFGFASFIYPPLYYYVSALPSYVLGLGLLAPRLVSFASILGCFALLARWVRDETGDTAAGFAAAGLL
ncbi:MAG: hypothetical protein ABI627_09735, partial [Polyangiaceae bacterium]